MYIIIVGAGGIGSTLLDLAANRGENVVMIESDTDKADEISRKHDCLVLNADATSEEILNDAGAQKADALIATTSDDATNLMIITLGKELNVPSLVSVVNNKAHAEMFRKLGANIMQNPDEIVSKHLYEAVKRPKIRDFLNISGNAEIFVASVTEKSAMINKSIEEFGRESSVLEGSLVVAVEREEELLIPTGETEIKAGDLITVFSKEGASDEEISKLTG